MSQFIGIPHHIPLLLHLDSKLFGLQKEFHYMNSVQVEHLNDILGLIYEQWLVFLHLISYGSQRC